MHLPHFEDAEGLVGFKLCDCIRPPRAVHQPPGLRPAKNGDEVATGHLSCSIEEAKEV